MVWNERQMYGKFDNKYNKWMENMFHLIIKFESFSQNSFLII